MIGLHCICITNHNWFVLLIRNCFFGTKVLHITMLEISYVAIAVNTTASEWSIFGDVDAALNTFPSIQIGNGDCFSRRRVG